jgi:hypothetical protein
MALAMAALRRLNQMPELYSGRENTKTSNASSLPSLTSGAPNGPPCLSYGRKRVRMQAENQRMVKK